MKWNLQRKNDGLYGHRMPNWAYNEMTVESDGSETGELQLARFMDTAIQEDGTLSFSGHLPMPEELDIGSAPHNKIRDDESLKEALAKLADSETSEFERETITKQIKMYVNKKKIGYSSWYEWNTDKWGTKWDASDSHVTYSKSSIQINFNTAWDLPRNWLWHVMNLPECSHLRIHLVCEAEGDYVILDSNGKEVSYEENLDGQWFHHAEYIVKEPNNNGEITRYSKTAEQRWKDGEF